MKKKKIISETMYLVHPNGFVEKRKMLSIKGIWLEKNPNNGQWRIAKWYNWI
jgi:hypothetical protein